VHHQYKCDYFEVHYSIGGILNKFKREQLRKQQANLDNLTPLEIKQLEKDKSLQAKILELARQIHIKKFPEEYKYMFDDHVDYSDRKKGIDPMSNEYTSRVAQNRTDQGVTQLGDDGMPASDDTWKIAYKEAEALVGE